MTGIITLEDIIEDLAQDEDESNEEAVEPNKHHQMLKPSALKQKE